MRETGVRPGGDGFGGGFGGDGHSGDGHSGDGDRDGFGSDGGSADPGTRGPGSVGPGTRGARFGDGRSVGSGEVRDDGHGHRADPPGHAPAWLYRLAPPPGRPALTPASSPETVAEATACLGPGPVAWAVGLGHRMAGTITAEVPELGGGDGPFETLRMGTESSALRALLLLAEPAGHDPITDEALQGDRDFVRRGIPLDKVLRGIRLGHGDMAHAMMTACEVLAPPAARAEHMRRVSDTLFAFIDGFSSRMTEEYVAEHDRWVTSRAAARGESVRAILAGEPVDVEAAGRTLGYPLSREHLAVSAWCDPAAATDTADLHQAAVDFLRGQNCAATLVVPTGRTGVWAWGSAAVRASGAVPPALADAAGGFGAASGLGAGAGAGAEAVVPLRHDGVRIACGSALPGVAGFRQSHEEARRAARVARLNPRPDAPVVRYRDVEVVALLSHDLPAARQFVQDELGPLADDTAHAEQLRETLRHYLRGERSLIAAAEQMHVARNTVTYRVKRARALLGHDLTERLFEVHTALTAAHVLGPAVLRPAGPPPREAGGRTHG